MAFPTFAKARSISCRSAADMPAQAALSVASPKGPALSGNRLRSSSWSAAPNTRRYRAGKNEKKGQIVDEIRLDDNTYANYAIKRAIGFLNQELRGFAVCHLWPQSTYDHRYHTCVANLVLLPAPLAGLSDHHPGVRHALTYRSFDLFGWYPTEADAPTKPADYPTTWRDPMLFSDRVKRFLGRRQSRG